MDEELSFLPYNRTVLDQVKSLVIIKWVSSVFVWLYKTLIGNSILDSSEISLKFRVWWRLLHIDFPAVTDRVARIRL